MSENPAVPSLDENMSISQRVNLLSHRFNSQFDSEAVGSLIHVAKQNTNKIAVDLNGGLLPQSEINACIGQFRYTVYQILNEKRISDQFDYLEKLLPDENDNSNDSSNSSNSYNSNNFNDFTENGNYDGIIKNANSDNNDEFSDMADLEKLERLKENLTKEIEHLSKENRNLKELQNQNQNPTKYVIPQNRDSFFEYKNKIRQVENNLKIKERYIEYEMKENEKKIAQENHEIAVLQGSISHARYRLSKIDDRFGLINQAKSIPRSFNNLLGNNLGGNKGAQTARIVVPKQNLNNSSPRSKKFAKTQDNFMPVQEPVSNSAQVSPRNRKLRGNSEEDIENRVYFTLERNDDCEPIGENLPSKLDLPSNIETFA
ncbi:hypothetical protein TRFO_32847 [Tritrichomonas foetus]|uniref:Uncharacterized protein n=1 Tax=Tritrichomonas foetus TaxID=1144522 RepID=A0A1J4JPY4_9EUKA|nr:hypothetical protein TRFO_32847 [Tritrichomonas foetus]|eukprot:OHT00480.1 hypothetical protein TRFO_32847 [Tritrichomonas foetus]